MNVLILYSSTDGHTKDICEYISKIIRSNNKIEILKIENKTEINFSIYDLIIIGASIRYGKHSDKLYRFIKINKEVLDKKQGIFFSVNVVARKPEKNTPNTNPYIKKFLKISNWRPKKLAVFAGRVDYPNYNFFDKYIIKFIMFITNGPTDTSQSYEFTDWSKVDNFAKEIRENT